MAPPEYLKDIAVHADAQDVTWLAALGLAAGLVIVVGGSGTAVLIAAGAPLRNSWGAAPAVGTGVLALGGVALTPLGVPWGLVPAVVATICAAVAAAAGAGRLRAPRGARRARTDSTLVETGAGARATGAAVLVGSVLALVPVAVAMGRPDRIANAWDALFHLAAVDLVRTSGAVDPQAISELAAPGGTITYPFAWHAIASLIPDGVDVLVAVNVTAFAPTALFGVAGIAALAHSVFPTDSRVAPVAALLAAGMVGAPLAIATQPGLIPNAYGLALLPGVLARVIRPARATRADLVPAALAVAGIALSHGGALMGLLLLGSPWLSARVLAWLRSAGFRTPAGQRRLLALSAAGLASALLVVLSPTATTVAVIRVKPPLEAGELARRLITGDLGEWTSHPWTVMALAVVGGVVLIRRRAHRTLLVATALAITAYACAASPSVTLSSLTALWYTETRRIAPLVGFMLTVLAAYGVVTLAERVRRAAGPRAPGDRRGSAIAVAVALVVVAVAVFPGLRAAYGTVDDTFAQDVPTVPTATSRMPYLSVEEERMIGRLRDTLGPRDLVLGDSLSGAGHLAVLAGTRTVRPYHSVPLDADALFVSGHMDDLGDDPAVCAAVRRLGASHLYADPYPLRASAWTSTYSAEFTREPGPGARLIDRGGAAALYSLDACYRVP